MNSSDIAGLIFMAIYLWVAVELLRYRRGGAGMSTLEDPLVGANCSFCGQTADNFHVSDELWAKVEPLLGQGQACFKCFRIAAWHLGVRPDPAWQVSL